MKNVFTRGTQGIPLANDPEQSVALVPSNEDYQILCVVDAISNSVVVAHKIWDTTQKAFVGVLKYRDSDDQPPDTAITVGDTVVFYRVGDFANAGLQGFELHTEDENKTSWVVYVEHEVFFVQDSGNGTGTRVKYQDGSWVADGSPALALKTVEPLAQFYNSNPPFAGGRIYPAVLFGNLYYCFLQGYGPDEKIFESTAGGVTFYLTVDGAGHVKTFVAS